MRSKNKQKRETTQESWESNVTSFKGAGQGKSTQIKVIARHGQSQCYSLSHVGSFRPYGLLPARLLCSWDFPGKNTGAGCHFLLQGIFPTLGSNPGLWHCRQILYHLSQILVASHNGKRANNTHFFTICARNRTSFLPGLVLWCLLADPGEGNGNPLQYSYLENPMDRGAW